MINGESMIGKLGKINDFFVLRLFNFKCRSEEEEEESLPPPPAEEEIEIVEQRQDPVMMVTATTTGDEDEPTSPPPPLASSSLESSNSLPISKVEVISETLDEKDSQQLQRGASSRPSYKRYPSPR